jgi:hypothetical protein
VAANSVYKVGYTAGSTTGLSVLVLAPTYSWVKTKFLAWVAADPILSLETVVIVDIAVQALVVIT